MKSIILCCFLLTAGITATVAQSNPMAGNNTTNCSFLVELISEQTGNCSSPCTSLVVCVPPGSFSISPPCGTGWVWDRANVTPVIDACLTCGSPMVSIVVGGVNCSALPTSASGSHCAGCSGFTVTMSAAGLQIN